MIKKGTCMLNRRCNSWRQNVIKKEAVKILKHKELIIEIQCMWILAITGVTGTISKSLRHYLSNIRGKHKIKDLQKTALLVAEQILQEAMTEDFEFHITYL